MAGRDDRINKAVGAAITGAYVEAGLTLESLAADVSLSPTTTQRMTAGKTSVKVPDFIKIAAAVDMTPEDLMERVLRRLAKADGGDMSEAGATTDQLDTKRKQREAAAMSGGTLDAMDQKAATIDEELDTTEPDAP